MPVSAILADFGRFLLLKPLRGDVAKNWRAYFAVGVLITWLVGIGRAWDHPDDPLLARSGVLSLLYILALSAFIWLVGVALKPERWRYRNVLLMTTMTAAPGIIYAIPVERFLNPDVARATNLIFLIIVAVWRMALYYFFLRRTANLPSSPALVAALLPPTVIIVILSTAGVLSMVAMNMGGVEQATPVEAFSSQVLFWLAVGSWIALPVLMIAWLSLVFGRNQRK
jgi:hypothetical protein